MANVVQGRYVTIDSTGAAWTDSHKHVNAIAITVSAGGAADVHLKDGGTGGTTILDTALASATSLLTPIM